MLLRRAFLRALGEGALAGAAAGAVLGLWHIRLGRDIGHLLYWLALERLLVPAAWMALAGALLSLLLTGLAALMRRLAPGQRRPAALVLAGLGAITATSTAIAYETLFPLAYRSESPRLTFAAVAAVLTCGLLLVVARMFDLLLDPDEDQPRFRRRGLRLATAGTALLILLWASIFSWPLLNRLRASGHPSVIILSMDTLRADRMGLLGAATSRTPLLDALGEEGVLFTQASAAAPWTLPSHASLFTSQLPFDHDVRWSRSRLPRSESLLAEQFRDAGYRTGAFTGSGYVSKTFGFGQGFQIYAEYDEIATGGPEPIAAAAYDWIQASGDAPFFMFLHTYEPHSPFFHSDFADEAQAGRLLEGVTFQEVEAIHDGSMVLSEDEKQYLVDLYDGDVAHADRIMGGLLQRLRDEGRLQNTILVMLSDHGEDLWDHSDIRSPGHGHSLYQDLIHVPLFFRAPGLIPAGHRLHTPVSLMDVAPTLLALAGLPADYHHDGRSLETALLTATEPEAIPVQAESVEYGPDRFMRRNGNLKVVLTPTPDIVHHGIRLDVPTLEVFDLQADPREKNSIQEPLRAARPMVAALQERARLVLFGGRREDSEAELPPELEEQLRSLGYIQ